MVVSRVSLLGLVRVGLLACGCWIGSGLATPPPVFGASSSGYDAGNGAEVRIYPGRLKVKFRAGVSLEVANQIHLLVGGTVLYVDGVTGAHGVRVEPGLELERAAAYTAHPEVLSAIPVYYGEWLDHRIPSDERYPEQWNLTDEIDPLDIDADVDALEAWHLTIGDPLPGDAGPGVVIAILDTGIEPNHPDLAGKVDIFLDCRPEGGVPRCRHDDEREACMTFYGGEDTFPGGHGTGVGGVASANTNQQGVGSGIAGAAWNVRLWDINIEAGGGPNTETSEWGIRCARILAQRYNKQVVINMSYAFPFPDPDEQAAVSSAYEAGLFLVASAGNEDKCLDCPANPCPNDSFRLPKYPACYEGIMTVGASTLYNTRWVQTGLSPFCGTHENFLPPGSNCGPNVEVAAPGANVLRPVTWPEQWAEGSGTSFAAPHVAADAALVFSLCPDWRRTGTLGVDKVWNSIVSGTERAGFMPRDPVPIPDWQFGRISMGRAMTASAGTFPSLTITNPANRETIWGTVTVSAYTSDDCVIAGGVEFYHDRIHPMNLIGVDSDPDVAHSSDYSVLWDTTTVADGVHTLYAVARDNARQSVQASVLVAVDNHMILTVQVVGCGSVTSDPPGIDCGTDCSEEYARGTSVILTATPAAGCQFQGWAGDCTGSDPVISVTVDSDKTCTASFADVQPPSVVLTKKPQEGDTVAGVIKVIATATDNIGIQKVEFYEWLLAGQPPQWQWQKFAEDSTEPYEVWWDTNQQNGNRGLKAVAYDLAGNSSESVVNVIVANGIDGLAPWPQFAHDPGNTNNGSADTTANAGNLQWSLIGYGGGLAVGRDNTTYVLLGDRLAGITREGFLKWEYPLGPTGGWNVPVLAADGTIFVKGGASTIYAIRDGGLGNPILQWVYTMGSPFAGSSPLTIHPTKQWLYVASSDWTVHALKVYEDHAEELWAYRSDGIVDSTINVQFYRTGAMQWETSVIFATARGVCANEPGEPPCTPPASFLYRLNGSTGALIWRVPFDDFSDGIFAKYDGITIVATAPAQYVGGPQDIITKADCRVSRFSGVSGASVWTRELEYSEGLCGLSIAGEWVEGGDPFGTIHPSRVLASDARYLYWLDRANGTVLGTRSLLDTESHSSWGSEVRVDSWVITDRTQIPYVLWSEREYVIRPACSQWHSRIIKLSRPATGFSWLWSFEVPSCSEMSTGFTTNSSSSDLIFGLAGILHQLR